MSDVLFRTFAFIIVGSTYKAKITLISKAWHRAMEQVHPRASTITTNHLTILLKLFPDKKWKYYELSKDPNIT